MPSGGYAAPARPPPRRCVLSRLADAVTVMGPPYWTCDVLLVFAVMRMMLTRSVPVQRLTLDTRRGVRALLPALALVATCVAGIAILVYDHFDPVHPSVLVLATLTVAAASACGAMALRAADRSRQEARFGSTLLND